MADKTLQELPVATTALGAVMYAVQGGNDVAMPTSLFKPNDVQQVAGAVYAGPVSGSAAFPSFRKLVAQDIPDLSALYLSSSNGTMNNTTISNPTITGGTMSGVTAVFDEDKFTLRDSADTTRTGKFNVNLGSAGATATWTLPSGTATLVGRDTSETLTNKRITLVASSTSAASLRIPPGTAPSSPVNGDIWTTTDGLYARINGNTVGPFAAASGGSVTSFNGRTGAVTLSSGDVTGALGYTPFNAGGATVYTSNNLTPSALPNQTDDFNVFRSNAVVGVGVSALNGGLTNYGANGTGQVGLFSNNNGGQILLRPNGRTSTASQVVISTSAFTFGGNTVYHAGNFNPANKADATHTHAITDVSGLGTALAGKASLSHTHSISQVTGLQDALDAKAPLSNPSFTGNVSTTGRITASGGFGPASDPRLKDESTLKSVDNALDIVYNLSIKKGQYREDFGVPGDRYFIMADDNVPEEILTRDSIVHNGSTYNGWSADQMIAVLAAAVQELTARVRDLEGGR